MDRARASGYGSELDHLDDQLELVTRLFALRLEEDWSAGTLPRLKDEFSGTFVSGSEVRALLADRADAAAPSARLLELRQAVDDAHATIEARLAATRAGGGSLAWDFMRTTLGLSPTEQRALWVLTAVELSPRHRQLARYFSNDATRVHSDVGLVAALVYRDADTRGRLVHEFSGDGRLHLHRLVEQPGSVAEARPFLLRPLRVSTRVIELVHGRVALDREVAAIGSVAPPHTGSLGWIGPTARLDELRGVVAQLVRASERGEAGAVVLLAGPLGVGKRTLAAAIAGELGRGVLQVRVDQLPSDRDEAERLGRAIAREAALFGAVLVLLGLEALIHDERDQARLAGLDRALRDAPVPVIASLASLKARAPAMSRGVVRFDLPVPTEAERVEIWQHMLQRHDLTPRFPIATISARYPLTGGQIEQTAAAAVTLARGRGDGELVERDVHEGLRGVLDARMSSLGTRVVRKQRWDDVVLREETINGVVEFIARQQHRRTVYDQWGFARKVGKGLGTSALFVGPPGTGKTMVAGLIADELGLDLYQIDVSRIVSKYIGETEKNLSELFDAAEAGHAILLFDEADSLFAKRTEVKSSVDRYSNLEVNYLLQRMEDFGGITILTSNLESSIDAAFKRRIAFKLDFPFPDEDERLKLWRAMIPTEAAIDGRVRFEDLSARFVMSGGNIRNAVVRGAFLAAADGTAITMKHLMRAAELEYTQMGKVV
ncbi:MAG: ATP-binding protein [Kofleriaceae bacterium]|nr:ATP-binding protein [Kofleriaceae bacterium]